MSLLSFAATATRSATTAVTARRGKTGLRSSAIIAAKWATPSKGATLPLPTAATTATVAKTTPSAVGTTPAAGIPEIPPLGMRLLLLTEAGDLVAAVKLGKSYYTRTPSCSSSVTYRDLCSSFPSSVFFSFSETHAAQVDPFRKDDSVCGADVLNLSRFLWMKVDYVVRMYSRTHQRSLLSHFPLCIYLDFHVVLNTPSDLYSAELLRPLPQRFLV
ncbi:hypothetical protein BJX66DRAFT_240976 [Aspergillus keveii]|uniref:Uncharacterized protein n=1 Tax=Aspergillus keveii TaxID=714993 RepID=A0ABR4GK79_9EURO